MRYNTETRIQHSEKSQLPLKNKSKLLARMSLKCEFRYLAMSKGRGMQIIGLGNCLNLAARGKSKPMKKVVVSRLCVKKAIPLLCNTY